MEAKCFGYVLLGKIHGANSGHVGENSSLDLFGEPLHLLVRKRSLVRGIISRKWTDEIIMSPETPYLGKISWFYFLHYRHLAFIIAQFQNDDNFVLGIKD